MKPSSSSPRVGYYPDQPGETRAPANRRKKAPLRRWAFVLCVGIFLMSAFCLTRYFANIAVTRQASRELEAVYASAQEATQAPAPTAAPTEALTAAPFVASTPRLTPSPAPKQRSAAHAALSADELWPSTYRDNPSLRISAVFYELQRKNEDIVGWLKIDGVLEEAVCQRDNSYYLTHNALKQKSLTGALFLDEACDLKTVPTQMVIHGHNMKEGAMFGSLKKYKVKDADFYHKHPFIEFNTLYENGRYVIFAVCEVDVRHSQPDYLPFWQYVRFSNAEAFETYVEKARRLSHYRCDVKVEPSDRLLTLSTCIGEDENKRLLVMARRVRDDENELELNMAIYGTGNR